MPKLIKNQPKRFFAFGCSFTRYCWTTWPEIIAEDLGIEYYNFGAPSAGNEFMFNRLMQVDAHFNLNEDDLVIICWTNTFREDRYANKRWIIPGNVYMQDEYPTEHVKKYYTDAESVALHDFAYIKASRTLLEHKKCNWHFLQMLDLNEKQLVNERKFMQPSFYKILWNNDLTARELYEQKTYGFFDGHPTPKEHLTYLANVFEHNWKVQTVSKIDKLDDELHTFRLLYADFEPKIQHLKKPLLSGHIV